MSFLTGGVIVDLASKIEAALSGVIDPETKENVMAMGLIKDLVVTHEGTVSLKLRPASYHCPLAVMLTAMVYEALKKLKTVTDIKLQVVDCVYADEINSFLRSGEL